MLLSFIGFISFGQNDKHDYIKDSIPTTWLADDTFDQTIPIQDDWWKNFNDEILDTLINRAVLNNYDVLIALNRIDVSKANLRIEQGNFYPHFNLNAGWSPMQTNIANYGVSKYQSIGSASIDMSWEIDIIGSIRGRSKAGKELYYASKEEYNAVMVSICSQVASAYIGLRTSQDLLKVAKNNLILQKGTLEITEARYKSGLVSELDVAQAKTVYSSTKSFVPQFESSILQYINAIGVLIGEYPWALRSLLSENKEITMQSDKIAVSIPGDVIRQRPDIRAVERNILSMAAYLGATKADWWPKFYVNGQFGFASNNFNQLFNNENMSWMIAPSMNWTIFSGRQLNQQTKLYKAQLDEHINKYNQTILLALQEVDNSINTYSKSTEEIYALEEAVKQAKLTLDLSLDLYKNGLADFQNVLDAQRYLLNYQNSLATSKGNSMQALIQLYKALGGGWKQKTEE